MQDAGVHDVVQIVYRVCAGAFRFEAGLSRCLVKTEQGGAL
jgi:hypothetical protein